jgi:anti-sigma regulatory factor (Ser/Thr protein kinase)
MSAQVVIPVADASQVGEARRAATRLAEMAGLSETQKGEAAIVATELANNLAKYGKSGKLLLQPLAVGGAAGIEILAIDSGPGMADVQQCLRDGFSTSGTPGTGLGAVRRIAAEFDLCSIRESGTVVLARIGTKPRSGSGRPAAFRWGAISIPAPGEIVCGDTWRILEREDAIHVMIADGLGHGPLAADASQLAAKLFEKGSFPGADAFIENAHRAMSGTRGAAVAAGIASASKRALRYSGVGNIAGSLRSATDSRGLFSHNGTVGHQMRKVQQLDYPLPEQGLLIMHSDGLQTRWDLKNYPGLITRHPAIVAGVLYRDFVRGRDDVTVLVVGLGQI